MTLIEVVITTTLLVLLIVPIYGLLYQSRQTVAEGRYVSVARLAAEAQIERLRDIAQRSEEEFAGLAQYLSTNQNATFNVPGLPKWIGNSTASTPVNMAPYAAENLGRNGRIRVCLNEDTNGSTAFQFFTNTGTPRHDDYFGLAPYNQIPNPAWHLDLDNSLKATGTAFTGQLATGSNYRILPIRVEVSWGYQAPSTTRANDMAPKVAINAVIAPKTHFRRG